VTLCSFCEVFQADFLYLYALTIEQQDYVCNKFFSSKYTLLRSGFDDRFDLMINIDIEDTTELLDLWREK